MSSSTTIPTGASHSPDVAIAVPIFHQGELLGFAAVTAHVLDVGGSFPGINADAFDVYAEAKLYNAACAGTAAASSTSTSTG